MEKRIEGTMGKREKNINLRRLKKIVGLNSGGKNNLALVLREVYKKTVIDKNGPLSLETKMWNWVRKAAYQKVFRRKIVMYSLLAVAAWQVISGIGDATFLWGTFKNEKDINMFTLKSLTELIAALMFGIGIYMVSRKKQKKGLNFFRYGLLVNIFLSSVFKFYFEQFSAVAGVAFSVAVYYGLEKMGKELAN